MSDITSDLQAAYPVERWDEDEERTEENQVYKHLKYLTKEDVEYNCNRMREAAASLNKHADALETWFESNGST